eukprot:MONOS_4572.1-p1 / transcript=MONOS_4572.1 / gene=MONOS_4572 / organism=Monocercomonoides_exilis_PA203 / gene_product=Protein disulfide-isomerase precursor / transcript_product=Protein disulfide-isomerase precursor / location=Mono_scaffold00123:3428-5111(+) / protein_length=496 / sequence_SO=supercontig / SO=protein_coding / is_pseudo=false
MITLTSIVIASFFGICEAKPPKLIHVKEKYHDAVLGLYPLVILYHSHNSTDSPAMYEAFTQAIQEFGPFGVTVAEVNCSNIRRGSNKYEGEADKDEIYEWVEKSMKKGLRIFKTKEEVEELYPDFDHMFIGYFEDRKGIEFQTYESVASSPKDGTLFTAVINKNVPKTKVEYVHIEMNFIEKYRGKWDWVHMTRWKSDVEAPFVEEITSDNAKTYMESRKPVGFYFIDGKEDDMEFVKGEATKAAKNFDREVLFVIVDHNKHWRLTKTLGLPATHFPAFTLVAPFPSLDPNAKAHYPLLPDNPLLKPTISPAAVTEHIRSFLNGTLPLKLRSEPVPAEQTGKVVKVVGDTFNETILALDKYVFVKFTAPWCHKCKKLAPQFEEIAEELKDDKRVVLADFDITENDPWPEYVIDGFPTLLLFPANKKNTPIKCEEFYSIQKVRRFLRENIPDLKIAVDENSIKEEDEREARRAKMEKKMGIDRSREKKKYLFEDEL